MSSLLLLDVAEADQLTRRMQTLQGRAITNDLLLGDAWVKAKRLRARVVNISLGADSKPNARLSARYDTIATDLATIVKQDTTGWDPLFAVTAGNAGPNGSPDWGLFGRLRNQLPERVLIVGAASRQKGVRARGASERGIVDLYAPGDSVATFTSRQSDREFRSGASFATPLVAGAAALLFSFDPGLTATDVRSFLVQGASMSMAVVGIPFLDAYGALRAAAARPGAPLCGNRVWADPQAGIVVQRAAGGTPETIIAESGNFDPWSFNFINVHHGGKQIELAFSDRYVYGPARTWIGGTWNPDLLSEYSGAFKSSSAYWQDHDDSLNTHFMTTRSGQTYSLTVEFRALPGYNTLPSFTRNSIFTLATNVTPSCIYRQPQLDLITGTPTGSYSCLISERTGTWEEANIVESNVNHALDPQRRFAIAALGIWTHYREVESTWSPCSGQNGSPHPDECRGFSVDSAHTNGIHLWRVDRTGNWSEIVVPTLAQDSAEVFGMAINEQGTELMLEVARYSVDLRSGAESCAVPRHEWIALAGPDPVGSRRFRRDVPDLQLCWWGYDGAASGAALRQLRSPRMSPASPRTNTGPRPLRP